MKQNYNILTIALVTCCLLLGSCDSTGVDMKPPAFIGTWKRPGVKYYLKITETTWSLYNFIRTDNCYVTNSLGYDILANEDNVYTVEIKNQSNTQYEVTVIPEVELTMRHEGSFVLYLVASKVSVDTLSLCDGRKPMTKTFF